MSLAVIVLMGFANSNHSTSKLLYHSHAFNVHHETIWFLLNGKKQSSFLSFFLAFFLKQFNEQIRKLSSSEFNITDIYIIKKIYSDTIKVINQS